MKRVLRTGGIFFAISDRDWILDGANVHVSMVGFDSGNETQRVLDGHRVAAINADLTSGADLTRAVVLGSAAGVSFQGPIKRGPFDVASAEAQEMLAAAGNPNGRPNSDVMFPYMNAASITRGMVSSWIVDFGGNSTEEVAARYVGPFSIVRARVLPARQGAAQKEASEKYWLHWRPRPEMQAAIEGLARFLATPALSKHRVFTWLANPVHADHAIIVFARQEDWFFGVLQSSAHEVWALAQGTQLEDRPRYTPTTCFETFPFPSMDASEEERIGEAAQELDELRRAWLNPPDWTKEEVLEFPGSVDGPWKRFVVDPDSKGIGTVRWPRTVPKDAECAANLAKRTLTNL